MKRGGGRLVRFAPRLLLEEGCASQYSSLQTTTRVIMREDMLARRETHDAIDQGGSVLEHRHYSGSKDRG